MMEMLVCKRDLRTRLVGDGCELCNTGLALELARDRVTELEGLLNGFREWAERYTDCIDNDDGISELWELINELDENDEPSCTKDAVLSEIRRAAFGAHGNKIHMIQAILLKWNAA